MKKRESLQEFVERLAPCDVKSFTPESRRFIDAERAGLCKIKVLSYPWWRVKKVRVE